METLSSQQRAPAMAAYLILGPTGTGMFGFTVYMGFHLKLVLDDLSGKSSFVKLLTSDENIRIGHSQESETIEIQASHYIDERAGRSAILVDTPGFDDSRENVSDTDILEQIVHFLEPESGSRRKLNGIIYMHRISDPRIAGSSRKNIRMLRSLCGEENIKHVCIVTTNWNRVTEQEGTRRETDLRSATFKHFIDGGACMHRHTNSLESARRIISDLVHLPPVTLKLQKEYYACRRLTDTSAGRVLVEGIREMERKHEREMDRLKKETELAANTNNYALRAEFEQERKFLEEKMERVSADQKRLQRTLEEHHRVAESTRKQERASFMLLMTQLSHERREMLAQLARANEYELLLGECTNPNGPTLPISRRNCDINTLVIETAVIQSDLVVSEARCTSLERLLTSLQSKNEALLKQNAVPAVDALLLLVHHIESLHQAMQHDNKSVLIINQERTSVLGSAQAYWPLVNACKLQSKVVFGQFLSLSEDARKLTQGFTELTIDLTYEVTNAQERLEKLKNMMQFVETLRKGIDEQRKRWDEQKAISEVHIQKARGTIRSAERKRDSVESSRVIRNLLTLGLGEVFDFFDLNEELKDAERTVESAEQHVRACEQSIQQAILALKCIGGEIARLSTLEHTVEAQETTLQTSAMHGQALRTRTIDLTNASLDVSLLVGKLAATSETFAVHHTAQELARCILNFGTLIASEGRVNGLLAMRDSEALHETLNIIAQSNGENGMCQEESWSAGTLGVIEDMM